MKVVALVVVLMGLIAGPARAFEWEAFAAVAPDMRACLVDRLSEAEVSALEKGKPDDKDFRQTAKDAFKACQNAVATRGRSQCPPLPPPYDGPLFDAMAQIDETQNMSATMVMVEKAGVRTMALFARSRKRLHENERRVLILRGQFPDLLRLGAPKYFMLRGDLDDGFIEATLDGVKDKGYAFVGEVLYAHGDKAHGETTASGERAVDPLGPGTAKLLDGLSRFSVPVPFMTHWEVYDWGEDWPAFDQLYGRFPEQIFIWPHMGFGSEAQVREVLTAHRNVVVTTSKKEDAKSGYDDPAKEALLGTGFLNRCKALKPKWRAVLVDFKDQIMFATDAHKDHRWVDYPQLIDVARGWLGQLPRDVAEAIAYRNAERLYRR